MLETTTWISSHQGLTPFFERKLGWAINLVSAQKDFPPVLNVAELQWSDPWYVPPTVLVTFLNIWCGCLLSD